MDSWPAASWFWFFMSFCYYPHFLHILSKYCSNVFQIMCNVGLLNSERDIARLHLDSSSVYVFHLGRLLYTAYTIHTQCNLTTTRCLWMNHYKRTIFLSTLYTFTSCLRPTSCLAAVCVLVYLTSVLQHPWANPSVCLLAASSPGRGAPCWRHTPTHLSRALERRRQQSHTQTRMF